ncbi:MAG: type 1 glutamine amidotransferase [Liquorilactobacillus hordei]|uniref:type 1 glutamine amidotransferase n=1 Tax=Liquorilactobacillus hordei TaxID=468911 RepID=UPI0039E738E4
MGKFILQHVPFEKPGILKQLNAKIIKMYEGDHSLPKAADVELLIVLGGPMGVNDNYDWLIAEKELIGEVIALHKPVLGICLGAQLIAQVLGADVYPNENGKEVGFKSIEKQTNAYSFLPTELKVLHWHGDTFDLPDKAIRLYSSDACHNQAFIYQEKVIGLQFHMETTTATLKGLVEADSEYIDGNVFGYSEEEILNAQIPAQNEQVLLKMVDYIIK